MPVADTLFGRLSGIGTIVLGHAAVAEQRDGLRSDEPLLQAVRHTTPCPIARSAARLYRHQGVGWQLRQSQAKRFVSPILPPHMARAIPSHIENTLIGKSTPMVIVLMKTFSSADGCVATPS